MNVTENKAEDIFVSYSREQTEQVETLVNYLTNVGFSVFWDPEIDDFSKWKNFLSRKISNCSIVLVCWSNDAVESKWVNWEADIAKQQSKYLPITLDGVRPEVDSDYQIRSLRNWHASIRPREAKALALNIARRLARDTNYEFDLAKSRIDDYATSRQLSIQWFFLIFITFYYSISAWIASQNQGNSPLGWLIDNRPIQGSLIAIILVGFLSAVSFRIMRHHISFHSNENWLKKLPRLFIETQDISNPVTKKFGILKLIFAVVPMLAIIHFLNKIASFGVVARCDDNGAAKYVSAWSVPKIPSELFGHVYCFGDGVEDAARHGVTFIPLIEPIAIAILLIWLAVEATNTFYSLFKTSHSGLSS